MAYTSLPEIQRKLELSRALAATRSNNTRSQSGSITSGLANVLNQYRSGKLAKQATEEQSANEQLRTQEMQRLRDALTGATGPQQPLGAMSFETPEVSEFATNLELQKALREPLKPIQVGANERLIDPTNYQELVSPVEKAEPTNYNQPFLPDGTPNDAYIQYQERLRTLGKPQTNVTTNITPKAEGAYLEERAKGQAGAVAELEKAAESAYRANSALDRFVSASASGDQGALQPIVTSVKNLISSFGFNPEGLTDTVTMQQAIGDILGSKMSELGARGLTDRDMEVLRESLPRVSTSHDARVAVANVVQKANSNLINEYMSQAQFEKENYPDYKFVRPSWMQGYTPPEPFQAPSQGAQSGRFIIEELP